MYTIEKDTFRGITFKIELWKTGARSMTGGFGHLSDLFYGYSLFGMKVSGK
jgi:hypothetical protein